MKVYSSEIKPVPFNYETWQKDTEVYIAAVKADLIAKGFTGKYTGHIVRFHIADGHAAYMVAHKDSTMILIHLAYGDAYQIPDAHMRGLRRTDIVDMIKRDARLPRI